ncbi:hypothetical protein AC481_06070 [miscellaneous Crenarchaeota group archaeon SMTZ-80]|nr:MAG: hypothetical protein AC481_06070 [miscellaneous Crenarchaeota group archaeon SMTZ-80]
MITNLNPEIIEAFDKIRKVYLLENFENLSEGTEDILKNNIHNEDYLLNIKSTIELIIESGYENKISEFEDLFDLRDFNEELTLIRTFLIELLKGDPDVESIKSYILFNAASGLVKFGWNYSIFKRDLELIIGLFTAITSFSKEAIERQLKGLSVEGMEIKMLRFEDSDLALLFILSKEPSPILIKRMNQFIIELEREFGELFITMDHLDFTNDRDVKKKFYNIMVQTLKFDLKKLIEMDENKE